MIVLGARVDSRLDGALPGVVPFAGAVPRPDDALRRRPLTGTAGQGVGRGHGPVPLSGMVAGRR
jgi:hypothetical protein